MDSWRNFFFINGYIFSTHIERNTNRFKNLLVEFQVKNIYRMCATRYQI